MAQTFTVKVEDGEGPGPAASEIIRQVLAAHTPEVTNTDMVKGVTFAVAFVLFSTLKDPSDEDATCELLGAMNENVLGILRQCCGEVDAMARKLN